METLLQIEVVSFFSFSPFFSQQFLLLLLLMKIEVVIYNVGCEFDREGDLPDDVAGGEKK